MKILYILLIMVFALNQCYASTIKTQLNGKITDSRNGEPLIGATIYVPDLKIGTITDLNGFYTLNNLPNTKILIQVSIIGYRTIIETIDLTIENTHNFVMDYVATEINEVVITGLSAAAEQKRTPVPMTIVPKTELLQNTSSNIIDAISTQPGISQITTGSGISKPVIRGLGYNRIIIVHNGIRQEGQQWGDEHGIEIDANEIEKIEILKGPASLAYGSDALAGVINLIAAPTLPEGKLQGELSLNYQTNAGLMDYSANIAGNQAGFVWDLRFSNKLAHAYKNKYDGYIYNSGFRENAVSGMFGINKSWGYSHLEWSAYNLNPGIIEGERDSITGKFLVTNEDESISIATNSDLKSYTPGIPFQKIHHYKLVSDNAVYFGGGNIKSTIGFQQNHRKEFGESAYKYGLYFLLNTLNYDIRYNLPAFKNYSIAFGINGMIQNSENKGEEFLVPEYSLFDFGTFAIIRKSIGKFDISGGIRYDRRKQDSKDLFLSPNGERVNNPGIDDIKRFESFHSTFANISGSIGLTYQVTKEIYTKFNISRGFRAPNISELGSNGVHEGTLRYESGDASLKSETSLQFDYTIGLNSEHTSAEATVFYNSIDNYIFLRKLNNVNGSDSIIDDNTVFKFVSGNAALYGGEFRLDIHPHPLDWVHFENSFSFVRSVLKNQPDSTSNLPFTPAPRLISTIKAEIKKLNSWMANSYIKFEIENNFKQDKIYSAYTTETATPSYLLLNAGLGTEFTYKNKTVCSLFIGINNIADIAYQSHLSRLKYTPENYNTGRTGIYNMGRNISFRLIVPIEFK